MRKYFISGGTGFLGRAIVRNLLKREDTEQIVCLTRKLRPGMIEHQKLSYLIGDVIDYEYPRLQFTDLIHAAAEANDLLHPDQPQYYMTVVEGARRVFEWAQVNKFERVLFVSSGGVVKTDSAYCRAKRMSEWLAERYKLDANIVRVYSLVGEEMPLNGQYALGRFIWQAINEGCVKYFSGESIRSYLHVDECAELILHTLNNHRTYSPIDIGSCIPISVQALAHTVAHIFDVDCQTIDATDDKRPPNVYVPSNMYIPKITLDESLRRVRDYLRNSNVE